MTFEEYYNIAKKYSINTLGASVQAYHETNNFKSQLNKLYFNYAGIKCTKSWIDSGGKCINLKTKEFYNNQMNTLNLAFRVYNDTDHFLSNYTSLINGASRYSIAAKNRDCVFGYYSGMFKGGWATDPNYFKHLVRLTFQLSPRVLGNNFKETLKNSLNVAINRNVLDNWMIDYIRSFL